MKRWMTYLTMVALVSVAAWGCGGKKEGANKTEKTDKHEHGKVTKVAFKATDELACLKCGHGLLKSEKESHKCEDHAACEKCKLHEDSPLCCKIEAGDAKLVCLACGEVAGGDKCCKEDIAACQKCGYHEKSTLCCKVGVKAGFEVATADTDKKDVTDKKDDADKKDTDTKESDTKDGGKSDTDSKDADTKSTEVKDADTKSDTDATKSDASKTDTDE